MVVDCCPRLESSMWDGKFFVWDRKPFYAARYLRFFNIPLNLGSVLKKAIRDIDSANLTDWDFPILLHRDEAMFHATLLISIRGFSDTLPVEEVSGRFYARLFEGKYTESGKYVKDIKGDLKKKGLVGRDVFLFQPTCPRCQVEPGVGQTVVFVRVE